MTTIAPTMTPQQRFKAEETLRDALKAADAALSNDRNLMDNLARARKYPDLAKVAEVVAQTARKAEETRQQLDKLMSEKG